MLTTNLILSLARSLASSLVFISLVHGFQADVNFRYILSFSIYQN